MWLHYDSDCKVAYLTNKGSAFMNFFYMNESGAEPELVKLDQFNRKETISQTFFLPKNVVDCSKNEVMRAVQHCGKVA